MIFSSNPTSFLTREEFESINNHAAQNTSSDDDIVTTVENDCDNDYTHLVDSLNLTY
jgi:hypothetical protein